VKAVESEQQLSGGRTNICGVDLELVEHMLNAATTITGREKSIGRQIRFKNFQGWK
jgi:hypothetical protein